MTPGVPRLYFDEDAMNHRVVRGLRARQIDVLTPLEAKTIGTDDATQLAFAAQVGRILYSFNVGDFCRLHTEYIRLGLEHAGIIVAARQQYAVGEQVRRIAVLLASISVEQFRNRLEFL